VAEQQLQQQYSVLTVAEQQLQQQYSVQLHTLQQHSAGK
jgi:hypothetical protein